MLVEETVDIIPSLILLYSYFWASVEKGNVPRNFDSLGNSQREVRPQARDKGGKIKQEGEKTGWS